MDTQSILNFPFSSNYEFLDGNSQTMDLPENSLDENIFDDCYLNNFIYNTKDNSVASQSTLSTDSIINFDVAEDDINLDILLNEDLDFNDIDSTIIMNVSEDISITNSSRGNASKLCNKNKRKSKHSFVLPYTIKDLKPNNSASIIANLNNDDLSKGRPGDRLILSTEEIQLLIRDGFNIPTHLPLTKHEERALKSVRRKIRNKISAKNSRAKKDNYVGGLEERIVQCSQENVMLRHKLTEVEQDKKSLFKQVLGLQRQLAKFLSNSPSSGTSLMLLLLTFMVILCPMLDPRQMLGKKMIGGDQQGHIKQIFPGRTRMLLQESEDSIELGEPFLVTIRAPPSWQMPPKTRAVPLRQIKPFTNVSQGSSQSVLISKTAGLR